MKPCLLTLYVLISFLYGTSLLAQSEVDTDIDPLTCYVGKINGKDMFLSKRWFGRNSTLLYYEQGAFTNVAEMELQRGDLYLVNAFASGDTLYMIKLKDTYELELKTFIPSDPGNQETILFEGKADHDEAPLFRREGDWIGFQYVLDRAATTYLVNAVTGQRFVYKYELPQEKLTASDLVFNERGDLNVVFEGDAETGPVSYLVACSNNHVNIEVLPPVRSNGAVIRGYCFQRLSSDTTLLGGLEFLGEISGYYLTELKIGATHRYKESLLKLKSLYRPELWNEKQFKKLKHEKSLLTLTNQALKEIIPQSDGTFLLISEANVKSVYVAGPADADHESTPMTLDLIVSHADPSDDVVMWSTKTQFRQMPTYPDDKLVIRQNERQLTIFYRAYKGHFKKNGEPELKNTIVSGVFATAAFTIDLVSGNSRVHAVMENGKLLSGECVNGSYIDEEGRLHLLSSSCYSSLGDCFHDLVVE
jgi:hypothetical protein